MVKMRFWGMAAGLVLLVATMGAKRETAVEPASQQPASAERTLMLGDVDAAVNDLRAYLSSNPNDSQAHLLLCRAYYAAELSDAAVGECEAAITGLSANSEAQDWLGRACGEKAQSAGYISGYKLAHRVQAAFERAVEIDPKNGSAVNDLAEYYIAAPSIIGGGVDKAIGLADRELKLAPQAAHRTYALAAEANKDYAKAEAEFRAAVQVGYRADAWADLGHFYARRKQNDQAVDALRKCAEVDKQMDSAVVDAASILMEIDREPELVEKLLRGYLAGKSKNDAAPAFKVRLQLGRLLEKKGDKAGARAEFEASLAQAHDYVPTKKALQSL